MDHFIDMHLLPDPELTEAFLLNAIFSKLHRALVDVGQGDIAVSFPVAKKTLGNKLRLHGTQSALTRLMGTNWLKGLKDYAAVSDIALIPLQVKHRVIKRIQVKSSVERLVRRSVKNGRMTEEEAALAITNTKAQTSDLPYLNIKSNSNRQEFKIFIQQMPEQEHAEAGKFNNYGLSSTATIPVF